MTMLLDAPMHCDAYDSGDGARFTTEALALDPPAVPEFAAFLEYWTRLKGDRIAPAPSALDPVEMRCYLSTVTLVRYGADEDTFYFGLSGTAVYGLHNRELSHSSLWEMRPVGYARLLHAHFSRTIETGAPNAWRVGLHLDDTVVYYKTLRAPLSEDGGGVTGLVTLDLVDEAWRHRSDYFDRAYGRS